MLETALFAAPAVAFLTPSLRRQGRWVLAGGAAAVLAGALWRIDAFITCYDPGRSWT